MIAEIAEGNLETKVNNLYTLDGILLQDHTTCTKEFMAETYTTSIEPAVLPLNPSSPVEPRHLNFFKIGLSSSKHLGIRSFLGLLTCPLPLSPLAGATNSSGPSDPILGQMNKLKGPMYPEVGNLTTIPFRPLMGHEKTFGSAKPLEPFGSLLLGKNHVNIGPFNSRHFVMLNLSSSHISRLHIKPVVPSSVPIKLGKKKEHEFY